ncbi:hypothetical protein [Rhodohalobacter barkolensis]|uniref:Uncharacterized protein n=1 Tax=Rhodohalobacter barkolensis TaxID=2053187 RepID=A0A2N0VHT8_9BACT|nr:hypothetical protein [Rhodohalobacter barkolensis]PKD43751.1 hypothetical protein CWD77_09335 [Rhodohalobacter barkolensis]
MKRISNKLTVGKEHHGLDLYCSVKLDGEEIQRFRSRSFLGSFAWMLQSLMHGGNTVKIGHKSRYSAAKNSNQIGSSAYDITSSNGGTPLNIRVSSNSLLENFVNKDDEYPNYIIICGAPEFNGIYHGVKTGSYNVDLYHLDGTPVDGSIGTAVGGKCMPNIGFVTRSLRYTGSNEPGPFMAYAYQNWKVIVGRSNKPVQVDDIYLWDRIMHGSGDGLLAHGTVSVSPLTTDKPTSRFTISQPFTNAGTTPIDVNEIGISCSFADNGYSNGQGYAIVRDTLDTPVSIPVGKTLSVDYELIVRLSPDTQDTDTDGTNSGFLQMFMNRIRLLANSDNYGYANFLNCASSPGLGHMVDNSGLNPSLFGIKLGDNNQFTSMTDEKLNINDITRNGFDHGDQDGQLYHYGTDISLVNYDFQSNKATFSIKRIFENKGSVATDVKEIGLFGNINTSTNFSALSPALLARTALGPADQFTINPGEFVQVEYVVEVIA